MPEAGWSYDLPPPVEATRCEDDNEEEDETDGLRDRTVVDASALPLVLVLVLVLLLLSLSPSVLGDSE